jgi:hypothetical protein
MVCILLERLIVPCWRQTRVIAFQTAVALAEFDDEKDEEGNILLKDNHLRSIVDMSRDFKRYLDETHGADEEKRAAMLQARYDDRGDGFGIES